ncbi:MAG: hypothetical protein AAGE05_05395 [Pseudomonadota bacterium]
MIAIAAMIIFGAPKPAPHCDHRAHVIADIETIYPIAFHHWRY